MTGQSMVSSPEAGLLSRVTDWVRRSQSLSETLTTTVTEVGQFLNCDRVKIYQFLPDETGRVVAEWIREQRLPSLLGLTFPADDIPPRAREVFIKTRARSIVNLAERAIGQTGVDPTAPEEIRYRPLDSCHAEYLTAMGVKSSLVMPILQETVLWGLLVVHHAKPQSVAEEQVQALQMVVDLLTVAIAQFNLTDQARAKAERESVLNQICGLLHSLSTIELQAALECTVSAFKGSGGRLWVYAKSLAAELHSPRDPQLPSNCVRLFQFGSQPKMPESAPFALLEEYGAWKERFQSEQDSIWAIANLYKEPMLRNLQPAFRSTNIRGLMIIPLWYRQQLLGYLTVFRDEIETEILWAGRVDPDQRQLYPRQSFEVWKETYQGQIEPWTEIDLEFACAIAQQFTTAIQQYETHQQLQVLNASLELQVQERTARLEQLLQQTSHQAEQLTEALSTLQQTQSQLIQTEKMSSLGQLVAGVAHEINNPVNFIHGNISHLNTYVTDLLSLIDAYQMYYPNPRSEIVEQADEIDLEFLREDFPRTLSSLQVGTDRIRQIVLSLRNFSRLDQAECKAVDIHEGIDNTLLILQHRLSSESKVIKEYGDLPLIECYAGQLNQVFMNLLSNAIDALEETNSQTPQIWITTKLVEPDRVAICIRDNGSGIPENVRSRIFDPFFTTKPIGKGTGMGLAISYEIVVQKHGGTIQCISELNHGTEFWIELPVRQE
ncbi:GAF domain-containing sensor histidine kinase [Leptolyngbya sp. NIES-2104]|uniref:GAF domain-containing sensor histidine kinase n=1 Tax=Leptolyngbya sp. NIES-2104 TaxID=1552121 RepID=UPI0006EC7C27|nr:ATP-binding protein [Leptolyngbya sp. NIES-2104]GAP94941.1 circadian input kinase A [Leptolyngbya sp. NIES-2104]